MAPVQKIVLASTSGVKYAACKAAFPGAQIIMAAARSGVADQPVGDETLRGARTRLGNARVICPDADLYISIENGIFEEGGAFIDRAVVLLQDRNGRETILRSEGVAFPADAVAEARRRGFQYNTVGSVMAEQGLVADAADPHLCLTGRSRADYLQAALRDAAERHQPVTKATARPRHPRR